MSTSQRRQFQDIFANVSSASASLTPSALTTGTSEIVTVTVPGAAIGDIVFVSAGTAAGQTAGIQVTGRCDAAGVVSIEFSNTTAGTLTPVAGVYTVVSCTLDPKMSL
jgi:hypothetical protein